MYFISVVLSIQSFLSNLISIFSFYLSLALHFVCACWTEVFSLNALKHVKHVWLLLVILINNVTVICPLVIEFLIFLVCIRLIAMELGTVKLLSALSLLILTFFSSMIPVFLLKRFQDQVERGTRSRVRNFQLISFLNCFGGGVFLATCLLHLFPDVREQMDLIFKRVNIDPNYPVAEFLLAFGFLTVLIVEQIVLNCQDDEQEKVPFINQQHTHSEPTITPNYANYGSINENVDQLYDQYDHEVSFHQDQSSHSILRSLLLVLALSLHSIFEGLAIGLQTSAENVIRILIAVLIHKSIIAFTLGLNLSHSKLKKCNIIKGNIFFSLTSPLGIIIGLMVVDFVKGLSMIITSGILQGLAAGTFLYVTFFEVLPHELNSGDDRMVKMACLVLGFSVVSLLLTFLPG